MRFHAKGLTPGAVFGSLFGILDIKSGVRLILLFGILNKIGGAYGLLSAFFGGTLIQLSYYLYQSGTLAGLVWGLKVVGEESSASTLLLANLYALDHILQTIYTLHFAHSYWLLPHDGHRVVASQAQQDLVDLALSRHEIEAPSGSSGGEREAEMLAKGLWDQEKGTATIVLVGLWFLKIYFILVIYSYAAHLRSNTYHSLPLSSSSPSSSSQSTTDQYASTAPDRPSNPAYRAGLGNRNKVVGAGAGSREGGDALRGAGPGGDDEEFRWDSDEEGENGSGKKRGSGARDTGADVYRE